MKKSAFIYLTIGVLMVTAFVFASDAFAQSQGEDEIIRVVERVLGVVLDFFAAILNLIGDFLKDLIPFFGDDAPTE
jgi:hypothetical protein